MTDSAFIEKYIFKVRSIFDFTSGSCEVSANVQVVPMESIGHDFLNNIYDQRLLNYLNNRMEKTSWILFLYKETEEIKGYGFLHIPGLEEWNDSLPTFSYEARSSSRFVFSESRGQGIHGQLSIAMRHYAQKHNRILWSVIENSNDASIRAAIKTGILKRKNYLIKIAGRNVISVLTNPFKFYVLYGSRRARR